MSRLTARLTEENDIRAVFSGVAGAEGLRTVLASLDTKKQALILGHAAPMPVVIRVREYDEASSRRWADATPGRAHARRRWPGPNWLCKGLPELCLSTMCSYQATISATAHGYGSDWERHTSSLTIGLAMLQPGMGWLTGLVI